MNTSTAVGIIDGGRICTAGLAAEVSASVRLIGRAFCVLYFSGIALLPGFVVTTGAGRLCRHLHRW